MTFASPGFQRPSPTRSLPRVLCIAGSDPSGGAGIQADLKSIMAAGGYGLSAITALTVQNTHGVRDVHAPAPAFLTAQLEAVSDDITIEAVKTGMLATTSIIEAVTAWLDAFPVPVLVVDPVMVATSGDRLLDVDADEAMRALCGRATVVTPNIGELAVLVGEGPADDVATALDQARRWAAETGVAVVVKTGHLTSSSDATNYLVGPDGVTHAAPSRRLATRTTHGTGCSLSSALATRLGAGDTPEDALVWVTSWLHEAIANGPALQVGQGHGPVDHSHLTRRLAAAAITRPWFPPLPAALHTPDEVPQVPDAEASVAVPAAGVWTRALWNAGWPTWQATTQGVFLRGLMDGSLPEEQFRFYLGQDALYLADYARALAALATRAPSTDHTTFWSQASTNVIVDERMLHTEWLKGEFAGEQGPVTSHYTAFLLAATLSEPYVAGASAVLPCFWLYAEAGALIPHVPDNHPYASWLRTYNSPEFAATATRAAELVEEAMAAASPTDRARALRTHLLATRHEREFFEQATRLGPGRVRA